MRISTCIVLVLLLCAAGQAHAQMPAALPYKEAVPMGEALGIDGDWKISIINKRIRIEGGRAYAIDSWVHALLWRVNPGMVVIRDLKQTEPGHYAGDDLPLAGRATMQVQEDGTINVHVAGAFGPVRYILEPVEESVVMFVESGPPDAGPPARGGGPPPRLGPRRPVQPDLPEFLAYEAYTGCDGDDDAVPTPESPRERMENANRVDKITQRRFASFSLDEVERGQQGMEGLCWFRLDGVWRELGNISLDRSKDEPEMWGSDSPELIVLANGNYTAPKFLYIGSVGHDDTELYIAEGFSDAGFAHFTSDDGLTLKEVLQRGGPVKRYTTREAWRFGQSLSVDVTRSGRVRLKLGGTTYVRPSPGVSKATMSNQIAANDAFLLGYNLENLAASRRGYDVVKQDPFYLLENPKFEVFAEAGPQEYFITEKRTVPLGFTLIQEASQGMVFNKSVVSSGKEFQATMAATFGASIKGNTAAVTGVPVKTAASFEATISGMTSWEKNKTVAQAIGYSRAKQYALVVDHPYVTLSDDFIDAIEDARRYGNYQDIIERFGTHYPYAVTYGAAAKVTQSFTEESWKKAAEVNAGFKAKAGTETLGNGGSAHFSVNAGLRTGSSGSVGEEGATFVAVGGNGSWNENGYSAGQTPYPILLDLRPLHELLNPLNFPGEPEIYQQVREDLRLHTEAYYSKYAGRISDRSLLPYIEPKKDEPIETWHIYVRHTWCTGKNTGFVKTVEGTLSMEGYIGGNRSRYKDTGDKKLSVLCKKKRESRTYSYGSKDAGLLVLQGTRSQIAAYTIALDMDWRYLPWGKNTNKNHKKQYKSPDALKKGLKPGTSKDYKWVIGEKNKPDWTINLRMKRIR
jgi:hypothetical protein